MHKALLVVIGFAAVAFGQNDTPVQFGYAANMNIGDSVVNLTNSGAQNGFEPAGNLCANIYVFSEDQQLVSCCACPLTPNHLKTLSVRNDLISNTLTPGVPIGVTIGIAGGTVPPGGCNAAAPGNIVAGVIAFGTTIHANPDGTYTSTNYPFVPSGGSDTEGQKAFTYCGFIQANGSGYGICKSCREGAAGAARQ